MSVFIFLNIFWIITTCLWSSLRVKALFFFFFFHTGDEIRIKTNETDLKVLFASLWADRVHEEHHEGPGSLRRRFPVLPESSAQKSRAGGGAPEPDRGDDPEPEEGACLDVCMSVRGEWWWFKTESEKTSWEITFWCHLTKASLVSTELLPARGRGGILLKGTLYLGFHSSGRRGCLLTERGALIPLWFPPGGCCPDVGQWHLQQQAGDVQDVEGLLRPDHHHQQSRGLHLLRRAQEVIDGQGLTTFPDHPLPSLSNQVQSNTASERWSGISYHGRGLSLPCDETKKRKGNAALPIYDVFIICIYLFKMLFNKDILRCKSNWWDLFKKEKGVICGREPQRPGPDHTAMKCSQRLLAALKNQPSYLAKVSRNSSGITSTGYKR